MKLHRYRDDAERGSVAPAIAIMGAMFLALAGLIIDSSRLLTARARAVAYAEEAARAGAQGVDPLSGPPLVLDPQRVADRVAAYCEEVRRLEPTVTRCEHVPVDGVDAEPRVVARASITIETGLLGLVNIHQLTARGTGEAEARFGVSELDVQ